MAKILEKYLGDGVYVSFDGYHINIAVNDHTNHVVALEPTVVDTLIEYFKEVKKWNIKDE